MKDFFPIKFPVTIGGDFSGVVREIRGNSEFKVGDKVYGQGIVLNGSSGSFAQFLAVNSANIAHVPKTVDAIKAAGLPLIGASAIQAIEDAIKLKKGQKILIRGGAGGIGGIAIQLSKSIGAQVATTASEHDIPLVKKLGADIAIDYHKGFSKDLKDFDAVLDLAGGDEAVKSFAVLKKGGVLVSLVGQPDAALAEKQGVTAMGQMTCTDTKHLNRLTALVDSGVVSIRIDKVFAIDQAREAFTRAEQGHPQGKVVLTMK